MLSHFIKLVLPLAPPFTAELCLSPIFGAHSSPPSPGKGGPQPPIWLLGTPDGIFLRFNIHESLRQSSFGSCPGAMNNIWLLTWLLLLPFSSAKRKALSFADGRCYVIASSDNYRKGEQFARVDHSGEIFQGQFCISGVGQKKYCVAGALPADMHWLDYKQLS